MARRVSDPEIARRFGRRLRKLRDATRRPQEWLADRVGLTPATISRFESGNLAPTLTTVDALARGLGIPIHEMFRFEESPDAPLLARDSAFTLAMVESSDTEELTRLYHALSAKHQRLAMDLLRALANSSTRRR